MNLFYTHTHTHTHEYTYTYIHTYIHIHSHTHAHIHIHTYTHIHTHTHSYTYTYTYTHTHTPPRCLFSRCIFHYVFLRMPRSSKCPLSYRVFSPHFYMHFLFPPYVSHAFIKRRDKLCSFHSLSCDRPIASSEESSGKSAI
jgi:hypothetical protein